MSATVDRNSLPRGLRQDWPVPRQDVSGTRAGFLAHVEHWLALGALMGVGELPWPVREKLIGGLARVARRVDRSHSDAAREFITTALGAMPRHELEARVLEAWRHFLRVVVCAENFARRVPVERIREYFTLDMAPGTQEFLASKRGRIVITGHIGDWEAGSAILPWLGCDPLYVVSKPPKNKPMSQHVQRAREARGIRLLPRRGAMQHAAAVIGSGGTLAMLLDQRARTRPVFAPFFGRMARCDRSVGILLRRLKAPAVIGACWRTAPLHWHVKMSATLQPEDLAGMSPEAISTRINGVLEQLILERPDQYFWLHDRYRGADELSRAREAAPH